ncbi:Protein DETOXIFICATION 34 [Ananas comosus]|uniref:Protein DETOXIFICATION n=1 Tax=Ananas comosus TaxID=4615 RepID=A0A199UQN3_ANACO|nr:Protein DETOXIFICATION 34 [Ananas comosus]
MGSMDSPLLLNGDKGVEEDAEVSPQSAAEDAPVVRTAGEAWRVFAEESRRLWAIAAPIAFNIICLYGTNSTTQIFVGHLGDLELSAVAISLSVVSTFSFGFLMGMGSALETLCGQAFGAGQVAMLGVYLQRSWIILLTSAALMCPIYVFATPALRLLGQEEAIAVEAGKFTVSIIPQLFAIAVNFPTQKFLQAQSKVMFLAWIGFATLVAHVAMLELFIFVFGWGLAGAAVAYNLSAWMVAVAQVTYVVGWCKDGWRGLSSAAFRELWAFVKLSFASAIMLCLEIWYMMVLVLLTGHLNNAEIAVDSISICMSINGWEGMLFIGINAAISVRVSNELGSGRPRATMYAVIVVVVQSLAIGLLAMAIILASREHFAVIFTNDKELQRAVAKLAYLLAVTMVLNSVQPVISGVAVGGGWQGLVAYINLGCYYIFGLPLGFILGYVLHLGPQGIWAGMLCGTALQTAILLYVVWKTDWKAEAAQASERVRLWGGEGESKASKSDIVNSN